MEQIFKGILVIICFLLIIALSTLARAETLTWDKNPDAVTYEVFVREAGTIPYTPVVKGVTGTSTTVTPAVNNKTYEYVVVAVNECGNRSEFSDPAAYNKCINSTVQKVVNLKITISVTAGGR